MPGSIAEALLTRLELERLVALHAMEDPEFRARLLEDPKAALEKVFGDSLPEGLEIQVVERKPGALLVTVPPQDSVLEMSELELEAVAGGVGANLPTQGNLSIQDIMRLQYELMQLNMQQGMAGRLEDKSNQGVQTLFKGP